MSSRITNDDKIKILAYGEMVDKWQLWDFFEVKGFLYKSKRDGIWIAAFLAIKLLSQKPENIKRLPKTESHRILHQVYKISQFPKFLRQLILGDSVKVGEHLVSLDLMHEAFTTEIKMRSYCQQEYGIDKACLLLITGGKFSEELIEALKKFDMELQSITDYPSTKSAIKQTLGIDFGTHAYYPFLRILAPIELKISNSQIKDSKIIVNLSSSERINSKDVRISLEGYNQQGQATDFSKNIKEFEPLKEQKTFRPIFVEISSDSLYIKMMLYYKDEVIEDFFLKNIKYEPTEILQKVETAEQTGSKEKKKSIKTLYERALRTTKASEKGKLLEHVITELIKLVPKLMVVGVRVDDGIQEVDIYVRNFNREGVWADFEGMIFVECKNWSDPVGAIEIRNFFGKLETKSIKCGLFVSVQDITGDELEGAYGQIRIFLAKGYKIVILNGKDIEEILNCKDVSAKIDEKYIELYT